jgi:putative drug exporter of the RND superfamily
LTGRHLWYDSPTVKRTRSLFALPAGRVAKWVVLAGWSWWRRWSPRSPGSSSRPGERGGQLPAQQRRVDPGAGAAAPAPRRRPAAGGGGVPPRVRPHPVPLANAGPAILASAATVVVSLLCLLAADLANYRSLGPVGSVGIVCAVAAMLTLLPAVLVIFGRRLFWPFVPRYGSEAGESAGVWARVGAWVDRRPRPVWVGTTAVLAVLAAVRGTEGVADARPAGQTAELVRVRATLRDPPDSQAERATIDRLRDAVEGADAVVGGQSAQNLDLARASARDRNVVIPLVLLVVLVVLGLAAAGGGGAAGADRDRDRVVRGRPGAGALAFDRVLGFEGSDPSLPLITFIFLVALGIDYNIFLMSRVREESERLGTRAGTLKGLAVTGGVITSAGIVLAATFSVLAVLPFVPLIQAGVVVAFGVLLDTLVVRSVLVPALTLDLGPRIWWPSRPGGDH